MSPVVTSLEILHIPNGKIIGTEFLVCKWNDWYQSMCPNSVTLFYDLSNLRHCSKTHVSAMVE